MVVMVYRLADRLAHEIRRIFLELGCTKLLSKKSGFSPKSSLKCLPKRDIGWNPAEFSCFKLRCFSSLSGQRPQVQTSWAPANEW
jgi:hypothetical protein